MKEGLMSGDVVHLEENFEKDTVPFLLPGRLGIVAAWVFNLWGSADILHANYEGIHLGVQAGQLGELLVYKLTKSRRNFYTQIPAASELSASSPMTRCYHKLITFSDLGQPTAANQEPCPSFYRLEWVTVVADSDLKKRAYSCPERWLPS
jgi:hypothetical protein